MQLRDAAGNARLHRAEGDVQNLGDLGIGVVLEVEERDGGVEIRIELGEGVQNAMAVDARGRRRGDLRKFRFGLAKFDLGKTGAAPVLLQVFAVEGCKKPALHLGVIPDLVPFPGPNQKGFLSQIACVAFLASKTEGKSIERRVVSIDQLFKVRLLTHTPSF